MHTREPGLRAPRVHWLRCPSLTLHKTHMEHHVHRVGSSMKTRRARAPLLVLPSGPFHFRPRRLPFKTARVRRLREPRVARTTAGWGSGARTGPCAPSPARPADGPPRSPGPGGCHHWRQAGGASLATSFIHTFTFMHLPALIHSLLGNEAAQGPKQDGPAGAPGTRPPRPLRLAFVPDLPGRSASKWPFLFLRPCVQF